MTNDRAIELLTNMKNSLGPCASLTDTCLEVYQALDMAIQALEADKPLDNGWAKGWTRSWD